MGQIHSSDGHWPYSSALERRRQQQEHQQQQEEEGNEGQAAAVTTTGSPSADVSYGRRGSSSECGRWVSAPTMSESRCALGVACDLDQELLIAAGGYGGNSRYTINLESYYYPHALNIQCKPSETAIVFACNIT